MALIVGSHSASSRPSVYTAMKPANLTTDPVARKRNSGSPPAPAVSARMSTDVVSMTAAAICEATKRFQIRS